MYLRKSLTALALVLLLLLPLPSSTIMAADDGSAPHENPNIAELQYDAVAILGYYSQLLDNVLARAATQVQSLREKAPFANIPEGLKGSFNDFGNASADIAWVIPEIEAGLDNMNMLARQFRLEEMAAQRQQTQDKLNQAYGYLPIIEKCAAEAEATLAVPSSGPSRTAYEELQSRIMQLRRLLELFDSMLKASPESSLKALLEALPESYPHELLPTLLRTTEIILAVEQTVAFVGDTVEFRGNLSSGGAGLPNREVVLLLDGVPYLTSQTGAGGSYQGQLQIPYHYVSHLTLQALYYPQDKDIGVYLASKSSSVDIQVLFYTATLQLEIKGKSYPGLDTTLSGRFDYGDQPIPTARDIQIYLDSKLISQVSVGKSFAQRLSLGPETPVGEHSLVVVAPAQGRYGPVTSETTLAVVMAVPIIDVRPPTVAFMPFAVNLKGRVYSELGPVEGAVVQVGLGDHTAQAITAKDGTFAAKLVTGMSLSFIGSEKLDIKVNPNESWNSSASSSWSLVVINPILISLVAALLALILGYIIKAFVRRRRLKLLRPVPEPTVRSPGVLATGVPRDMDAQIGFSSPPQEQEREPRQLIFGLYRGLLRMIQNLTNIVLKPHITLREFAAQCAPLLGPAHKYLDQFTRLIERLLYSKHSPEPTDLEKGKELSRLVEESLKNERS